MYTDTDRWQTALMSREETQQMNEDASAHTHDLVTQRGLFAKLSRLIILPLYKERK